MAFVCYPARRPFFSVVVLLWWLLACGGVGQSGAAEANPAVALPCVTCHGGLTLAYRHPPVEEDCLNCHVPHFEPAPAPANLQDEVNDLCLGCHDDPEDTGGHPVVGHPTEGRPDPFAPSRPFTCLSCHLPHQSSMPVLFRYQYDLRQAAAKGYPCAVCHHRPANAPDPVPVRELLLDPVASPSGRRPVTR